MHPSFVEIRIIPRLARKSGEHRKDGRGMLRNTTDPLVVHIVPHLSSGKSGAARKGDRRDIRACNQPLGNAHCPMPATEKR